MSGSTLTTIICGGPSQIFQALSTNQRKTSVKSWDFPFLPKDLALLKDPAFKEHVETYAKDQAELPKGWMSWLDLLWQVDSDHNDLKVSRSIMSIWNRYQLVLHPKIW